MDEYESTPNFGIVKSFVIYNLRLKTAPTIGIQSESVANHNTLLRHFDPIAPAYTVPAACHSDTA